MALTAESPPVHQGQSVVLDVVRVTGAAYSDNTVDQVMCSPLFSYPLLEVRWIHAIDSSSIIGGDCGGGTALDVTFGGTQRW